MKKNIVLVLIMFISIGSFVFPVSADDAEIGRPHEKLEVKE